jgi:hypothetical protein
MIELPINNSLSFFWKYFVEIGQLPERFRLLTPSFSSLFTRVEYIDGSWFMVMMIGRNYENKGGRGKPQTIRTTVKHSFFYIIGIFSRNKSLVCYCVADNSFLI